MIQRHSNLVSFADQLDLCILFVQTTKTVKCAKISRSLSKIQQTIAKPSCDFSQD